MKGFRQSQEAKHITIDIADITSRYQDICPIGCGANAIIFSALDQQCHRRLAVKKVALKNCTSIVVLKHLFREIRVLRHLDHDNVVKIYHTMISTRGRNSGSPVNVPCSGQHNQLSIPSQPPLDTVYIGLELMDTDLQNVLMQRKLSMSYTKLFTYQLLRGLKYIHSANVIHRDITPSNLFINVDTLMLKIGDFGVCRIFDEDYDHSGHLSMTLSTTRYQSPELLLHPRHYNKAVDMWAAGCIFAEMLGGKVLFNSDGSFDHVSLILNSISVTSQNWRAVAAMGCNDKKCCAQADAYDVRDNGGRPNLPLRDILPQVHPMAINFLQQLLAFDPADRITATDALMHPFMSTYAQTNDEPVCQQPFRIEDELDDFSYAKYQQMLRRETSSFMSSESTLLETSNEDSFLPSRGSRASICQTDSYKNLLAIVHSNQHSNGSSHSNAITESEARTIACDYEYGVQITDGSVNRERLCLDFLPVQSNSECFDPYKWDHHGNSRRKDLEMKSSSEATLQKTDKIERHIDASHSDHGYSSYCSSNTSHGRPLWSLSSPDLSLDHDRFGGSHRASTPEMGDHTLLPLSEPDDRSTETRHSPVPNAHEKSGNDVIEPRRRHKDDVPRHHQNYGHYYHHHHHHHHHHHKHHRHSSRHSNSSFSDKQQQLRSSSNEGEISSNGSGRFQQRRCVEVVPEDAEEGTEAKETSSDLHKGDNNHAMQESNHNETIVKKSLKTGEKPLSDKPEAPSEHFLGSQDTTVENTSCTGPPVKDKPTQSVTEPGYSAQSGRAVASKEPAKLDTSVINVELDVDQMVRSRTRSDGGQRIPPGLMSSIQSGLNQFCFGSFLKLRNAQKKLDCNGRFLGCHTVGLTDRIATFSTDNNPLEEINESSLAKSLDRSPFYDSLPGKCSSTNSKPDTYPRKQVECPF